MVLPSRAEPSLIGMALRDESALSEPVNAAILRLTAGSGWTDLVERYAPERGR